MDFNKILNAKKAIEDRSKKPDFGPRTPFWKPTKQKSEIRILPEWASEGEYAGQFWREVYQHWMTTEDGKPNPIICEEKTPFMSGEKCDVCSYVNELRADKSNIDAQETANTLKAKVAYMMTIIDVSDPEYTAADLAKAMEAKPDGDAPFKVGDPKLQVYAAGPTVFNAILGIIQSNETDITSLKDGYNVFIEKNGVGINTKYTVNVKMKPSSIEAKMDGHTLPDLSKIGKVAEDKIALLANVKGAPVAALAASNPVVVEKKAAPRKRYDVEEGTDGVDDLEARMREALGG